MSAQTGVRERVGFVSFHVHGLPIAQGSKTPWGTDTAKGLKSWRQDIAVVARNAMGGRLPTHEPVEITAVFYFQRPKSHYGTGRNAETLKANAPLWVSKKPDLDKLMRALGDAITGTVLRDDSQIVVSSEQKKYGSAAGVSVKVSLARGVSRWEN